MSLNEVIAASTVNAAIAVKRPELGSFKPGCVGDATVLWVKDGRLRLCRRRRRASYGGSPDRVGRRGGRRTLVAPAGCEQVSRRRPGSAPTRLFAGQRAWNELQGHERLARERGRKALCGCGREPEARIEARVAKHDDRLDVEGARSFDARFHEPGNQFSGAVAPAGRATGASATTRSKCPSTRVGSQLGVDGRPRLRLARRPARRRRAPRRAACATSEACSSRPKTWAIHAIDGGPVGFSFRSNPHARRNLPCSADEPRGAKHLIAGLER